jgi:protein TonB
MTSSYNVLAVAAATSAMFLNGAPAAAAQDQGPKASCTVASAPPVITRSVPAETPPFLLISGVSGAAEVEINLSDAGAVESATIAKSSGNKWLDAAAIDAVREQEYLPEISFCQPVSGSYLVNVDFNGLDSNP